MSDPHPLMWKFWVSEYMAQEITQRDMCHMPGHGECYYEKCKDRPALAQILKKEWIR